MEAMEAAYPSRTARAAFAETFPIFLAAMIGLLFVGMCVVLV